MTEDPRPSGGATLKDAGQSHEQQERILNEGIEALIKGFIDYNLPPSHRLLYQQGAPFEVSIKTTESLNAPSEVTIMQIGHPSPIYDRIAGRAGSFARESLFISCTFGDSDATTIKASVHYRTRYNELKSARVSALERAEEVSGEQGLHLATNLLRKRGFLPPESQAPQTTPLAAGEPFSPRPAPGPEWV